MRDADITIYHSVGEGCSRRVLQGVTWQSKTATQVAERGLTTDNYVTVYIPAAIAPGAEELTVGDVIVPGSCDLPHSATFKQLRAAAESIVVNSISRRTTGSSVGHVKVVGK